MNFQKANNISGWVIFGIAFLVYTFTFEETASYWDCGEFIAVSYKLEVPHPPGAPLFLVMGRLFSFLSLGDVTKVAYWINFMSVVASSFTILFLFWSITLLGRKMMNVKNLAELNRDQTWILMGAGAVGALSFTFSDSFWFSAVEGEVYAMSAFFTAFVVWAILKWDVIEDESKANRWLILIAYMMGLSIGVHLLNLLAIPALGLIYYFKKYKPGTWGVIGSLAFSGGLIILINDLIIPGLPTIAGGFEIFFVNNIGLPFGSGALVFCLLIIAGLVWGITYSQKKNKPILNTFLLSITFIIIGYSSYGIIVIRSNFDPPINQNSPKDIMSFVRYLKREQYGSRPLLHGQYFTAKPVDIEYTDPVYIKGKDKYVISERKFEIIYDPAHTTILPRAWNPEHKESYMDILGLREGQKPTFVQNMYFMFRHQIGTMYMRYFMWNFAGRESDEKGADWLGPRSWFENVPDELANNRARNNFFMIPFALGLLGMFFQFNKDTKNFAVVGLLFLMLGLAIVVFLNSPPEEPRERDYIYSGSTYAFTFWIGLSVIGICDFFKKFIKNIKGATLAAVAIGLVSPAIMAAQGWDDHNRSDRFFSVDSAKNYLATCEPNAILFTGGDNDTFPLWYVQEVEGFRTDVRVVVLSYYNTDWYIGQTQMPAYESQPFKYTLTMNNYRQGGPNDYLRFTDLKINAIEGRQYLDLLSKDYPQLRYDDANILPSRTITIGIDVDDLKSRGIIPKSKDSLLVDQMVLKVKKGGLEKKDLAFLDLLVTNNWERPVYVNHTSESQLHFDLAPYALQEGMASRILPIQNPNERNEFINTEAMFDNLVNNYFYRGLDNPNVYYNDDYRGFVLNHRSSFNSLAEALIKENNPEKAREALLFSLEKMPDIAVSYDYTGAATVDLLFQVGEKEKALTIASTLGTRADDMLSYLIGKGQGLSLEGRQRIYILGELQRILYENGEDVLAEKFEKAYEKHLDDLQVNTRNRTDY